MHQIRFQLELCPIPRWELTALLRAPAPFGGPTSKGMEGREEEGRGRKGSREEETRKGGNGRGRVERGERRPSEFAPRKNCPPTPLNDAIFLTVGQGIFYSTRIRVAICLFPSRN